jgi:HK97 family phage major capsid protein
MKLVELRTKFKAATDELGVLGKKEDRTADDESRLDALLLEVNDLGPKLQRELEIEAASTRSYGGGRQADSVAAEGAEEREKNESKRDRRSMGQRFAESDQVKHYSGRGRGEAMPIRSFYHADEAELEYRAGSGAIERRDLVYTGALPASMTPAQVMGGVFRGDDLQGTIRDVLINGQTNSDAITFVRETSFTNNAAAVAEATATDGATGLKPESAMALEEVTVAVKTIAHWVAITRQTLQDAAQMRTYVEGRLLDGLRLEESDQLLNGSGSGANILGLTNQSTIQVLDQTYFTGAPVAGAGDANENFNRILRAKSLIRTTGRARASFAVLNPADSETFLTSTNVGGDYYGTGPFSGNGVPPLWGLRVVEDENQTAGEALVGDGRMAAVWDRMQAQILVDTVDNQFIRNMLTILAEERLALTVFRPSAFALVDLA